MEKRTIMRLFERKKYENGKREFYLCGIKFFEYIKWSKYNLNYGFPNYDTLQNTQDLVYSRKTFQPILSIIYPVYYSHNNFDDFNKLIKAYDNLPLDIKKLFELIIVDDGSKFPIKLPNCNLNITLLRINENIMWNQSGARNLGACYASSSKLLMMDAEWFAPEKTIIDSCNLYLDNNCIKPMRWAKVETEPLECHPNIFLINKQSYFYLNCYDEDWCGFYGEDLFFRRYFSAKGFKIIVNNFPIIPIIDNYITNASHDFPRKINKAKKKLALLNKLHHSKRILRFTWQVELVKSLD